MQCELCPAVELRGAEVCCHTESGPSAAGESCRDSASAANRSSSSTAAATTTQLYLDFCHTGVPDHLFPNLLTCDVSTNRNWHQLYSKLSFLNVATVLDTMNKDNLVLVRGHLDITQILLKKKDKTVPKRRLTKKCTYEQVAQCSFHILGIAGSNPVRI